MKLILIVSCLFCVWCNCPVSAADKKLVSGTLVICESLQECNAVAKTHYLTFSALREEERLIFFQLGANPRSLRDVWPWMVAKINCLFLKRRDKELRRAEHLVRLVAISRQQQKELENFSGVQNKMMQLYETSMPRVSNKALKDIRDVFSVEVSTTLPAAD